MITEGVKYTGSKKSILPAILSIVKLLPVRTVLDGFSGTTRVSQALKRTGYTVIANDIAVWSKVFGECYLLNRKPKSFYASWIEHLNHLEGRDGWFTEHYGGSANGGSSIQVDGKKRIWQLHNTLKLDAIREEIDVLTKDSIERSVLLTSLILAMDRVDSSLGHHVSYLREWSTRSFDTMQLRMPQLLIDDLAHSVLQKDIFDVAGQVDADLAYFDPPYGSSNELMPPSRVRYASYYHLWKTICLNDKPDLVGAASRRADAGDVVAPNVFEEFRKNANDKHIALEALEQLLSESKQRYILLSYSNGGRATYNEIVEAIKNIGFKHTIFEVDYKRHVMAQMVWTKEWLNRRGDDYNGHREYLFLMTRGDLPSALFEDSKRKSVAQSAVQLDLGY